jgi:hypothetical protein
MSRNVVFQPLRGTTAQLATLQSGFDPTTGAAALPLQMGEMFFATDTQALYFGTPGFGNGYIQIGDTTNVNERLDNLIVLMESVRRALVALVCDNGRGAKPDDFSPELIARELNTRDDVLS